MLKYTSMKQILFATGNKRKMREATEACQPFDIQVIQKEIEVDEIQSHDPLKISKHKVDSAFSHTSHAIVINDAFWEIPALNGFPGGYMKDINEWFTADDFINIMKDKTDRRICLTECVLYKDETITKIITKQFWGEIALQPRGIGNAIEQVAIFNGKTIGENKALGELAFDPAEYVWNDFAIWYSDHTQAINR
ncbi:MAG: RdgB/HAM1 family non-canonical purine pyrophosphatase, dITP/XTP pyrophosphatase [Candidatus Saccharibacteria bacterium]|nr:RdgB/HAM1 family non-canonical purine pyrophosphatase, dITP/XTP pyrophosphatase [Candidatus Saccharibacteria bacterium]